MAPKVPSAYMLFCHRYRAEEKARLEAETGAKVAVTAVAKALGQRWKGLSEEEKKQYKQSSVEPPPAALQQAEGEAATEGDEPQAEGHEEEPGAAAAAPPQEGDKQPGSVQLPLAPVRKIMLCDPEVSRISKDAVMLAARAAEHFLGLVSSRAAGAAVKGKRRTIKLDDFEAVVKADRRLVVAGLRDVAACVARQQALHKEAAKEAKENQEPTEAGEAAGGPGAGAGAANVGTSKKQKGPAVNTARIDTFFKRAAV